MSDTNTGLAERKNAEAELVSDDPTARVPQRITTPTQYRASLETWQRQGLNILSPATNFSGLPDGWAMVPAVVRVNPVVDAGEVYRDKLFCKPDEVALTKVALSKIAQAAGMSIKTFRTDDRSVPNYWEMQALVRFFGLDGTVQELSATQEWDLREGSARASGMSAAELKRSQLNGLRSCEARAINAAIRLFGIKQKYHVDEVRQPFMCVRVMFQPDMQDPEVRRLVTERAMQGTTALYGAPAPRAAVPELMGTIGATLDESAAQPQTGSTAPPTNTTSTAPATPALPDGYGLMAKAPETKTLERKKDKSKFTKWIVVDHNGVEHVTIKKEFGESLVRCYEGKVPVEIVSSENDYGENEISEINPLGAAKQSKLPDPKDL